MTAETVTVTCWKHRRRCALGQAPEGGGIRIRHAGSGDTGLCDSERFTVRREYEANRETAHLELLALHLNREAMERARENSSGTAAGKRED